MKVIFSIFLASFLYSCSSHETDLINSIEKELNLTNGTSINLANTTDFKWQQCCIIGPYYSQEYQDKILGFKTQLLVTGNDGVSTLVFIKNNKIISHINHPRNKGDFLNITNVKTCYEYNEIIKFK